VAVVVLACQALFPFQVTEVQVVVGKVLSITVMDLVETQVLVLLTKVLVAVEVTTQ
jgi:hypothetical protein